MCSYVGVRSPPLGNPHPNEDGYEVIAEAIADVVRT